MRCPYCRSPIAEAAPECPRCRLNLERVTRLLGAVPRFKPILGDSLGLLSSSTSRRLVRRVQFIQRRFPQIRIQIVCHEFAPPHPLDLYLFWLLNVGNIFPADLKDGSCLSILIGLDPARREAGIALGYGLEPFVDEEELDRILALASPALADQTWGEGLELILERLEGALEDAARQTADIFGLSPHPEPVDQGPLG